MRASRTLLGKVLQTVVIGDREFTVGPLTVGQRRRIDVALSRLPRPQPVVIEVRGLVEAMMQATDDSGRTADQQNAGVRPLAIQRAYQQVANLVGEQTREARARVEQWPPTLGDAEGLTLIETNPQIQDEFLWEVLRKHNHDFRRDELNDLVEDMTLGELRSVVEAVFPPMAAESAPGPDDPKGFDAGGEPASSPLPAGSNGTVPARELDPTIR